MSKPWELASAISPSAKSLAAVGTATLSSVIAVSVGWYADLTTDETPLEMSATSLTLPAEGGRHELKLTFVQPLSISAALEPMTARAQDEQTRSFRGLDALRHGGRTYLALATGEPKQAADGVTLWSSDDEENWRLEWSLPASGRAFTPRLLSLGDKLFVYVSSVRFGSEEQTHARWLDAQGSWHDQALPMLDGAVVSAVRTVDQVPLMTTQTGGSQPYRFKDEAREIRLLISEDGLDWHPPSAGQHAVYRGGGSDAAFSSNEDGSLLALVRKEAGDDSGWGSSVCLALAGDISQWDCVNDPKNYGAATLFSFDGEIYMVGQRKLSATGNYDLGRGSGLWRTLNNQVGELQAGRRCSLWRYDPAEHRIAFVADLPSQGDTCSPAVVPAKGKGHFTIYSPSSDLESDELALRPSQAQPNRLYRYSIALTPQRSTKNVAY